MLGGQTAKPHLAGDVTRKLGELKIWSVGSIELSTEDLVNGNTERAQKNC